MPVEIMKRYRGNNAKIVNPFIEEYIISIMKCTKKYHRDFSKEFGYSDYNLFGRERTLYSLLSAAMDRITPIHVSENSIIRKRDRRNPINRNKEQKARGRIDLWSCKDGIEYFFEFKRSYVSLRNINDGQDVKRILKPWKSLVKQITEVEAGVSNRDACYVGLQIITPYMVSGCEDEFTNAPEVTGKHLKELINRFKPRPPDALLRHFNPRNMRVIPIDWDKNDNPIKWEFHPFHLFCFTIKS